jgi:FixJ family two-component response regulator
MSTSPQAAFTPRVRPGSQSTQVPHRQGAYHSIPIDSPVSSGAIVYVVCNDSRRTRNLSDFFSSHSIHVSAFKTATEYITNLKSDRISCVVLDLDLPDLSGLEVQTRLTNREGPPVVFVAAHGDLNSGVCAMKNGAIDFMIEPFDDNRLLVAVETAFAQDRRRHYERVERSSLLRCWVSLTPREQDVFQYTVAGFLNKQAAAELGITENTFQVHRGRVMRKMKADSLADLVRMSTRLESLGYFLDENETAAQALAIPPNRPAQENWTNRSPSSQMRRPCANQNTISTPGGVGSLSYASNGTTSRAQLRLAHRGA